MKRDWDHIRRLLLAIEALPTEDSTFTSNDAADIPAEVAAYHMRLMIEGGLINGGCRDSFAGKPYCHASRLTWQGHELLDAMRRDTAWYRIKSLAQDKGLDLSLTAILALAKQLL